ncbi:MAG TPA: hypothetical protein VFV87_06025 [Pirellulaceae bacterium]|nr:hypothetical protein [Pirellulaceae bacterium]
MQKRPAAAEADGVTARMEVSLAPWLKVLLSVLLTAHVVAVVTPPFGFACRSAPGPEGTSPVVNGLAAVFEPYYQALYLDHGYFFFAPTIGPTHLVDYKVEFEDGRPPIEDRFPDLQTERPRLLYHRYFMMAEALNNLYVPPQPPPEPVPPPLTAPDLERLRFREMRRAHPDAVAAWKHRRWQYDSLRTAMEQHLLAAYGGSKVTLTRVEHRQAIPSEFTEQGKQLNDPASYQFLSETQ